MKTLFRELRVMLGTALTWALGWGATAAGIYTGGALILGQPADDLFWQSLIAVSAASGITGMIAGATFSVLLGAAFRNRRIEDLRVGRTAIVGGVVGAGIPGGALALASWLGAPVSMEMAGVMLGALGFAGAVTAGGTVRLAQIATGAAPAPAKGGKVGKGEVAGAQRSVTGGGTAGPAGGSAAGGAAGPADGGAARIGSAPPTRKPATPTPSASREIDDAELAAALEDDPEIEALLRDHRSDG